MQNTRSGWVQSLADPVDWVDTDLPGFYNTDVILPKLKPMVASVISVEEGEQVSKVQCESGNFPLKTFFFKQHHHTRFQDGETMR